MNKKYLILFIIFILSLLLVRYAVYLTREANNCNVSIYGNVYFGNKINSTIFWNHYVQLEKKRITENRRAAYFPNYTAEQIVVINYTNMKYLSDKENYFICK